MAWIQKRNAVWWIGWRHAGKEVRRSLKTTRHEEAAKELEKVEMLEKASAANCITAEFVAAVTGKLALAKPTVSAYLDSWLSSTVPQVAPSTAEKYKQVTAEFKRHFERIGAGVLMSEITADHIRGFLDAKRKHSAPGTVKLFRRMLSGIFKQAQNEGTITGNPVALAKLKGLANGETTTKRPFTLREVKDLHALATPFWKFMIQAAFFTGQSLGDLICLKRENVDLKSNVVRLARRKTNKRVVVPLSKSLREVIVAKWPKRDADFFWPNEAEKYLTFGAGGFSQEFYALMAKAGMVAARPKCKHKRKQGRNVKREACALGFHNLRHTFVSNLKISGAVDSVARELAGHSSNTMSAVYTHLPLETLADAVNQLPEFAT